MTGLKIVFRGEDIKTTITSKKINEAKLDYFLKFIDNCNSEGLNIIKIYRGSRKIRDISLSKDEYMLMFNKWIDYKKHKDS